MTMEYQGRDTDKSVTDAEGVMFAANPVWDRSSRKRRVAGRDKRNADAAPVAPKVQPAPEPRSFAARDDVLLTPVERTSISDAGPAAAPARTTNSSMFAPVDRSAGRTTRVRKSGGIAPAAIAASAVAVVAVGAAGWWASRDAGGVPELTPGSTVTEVAAAPMAPAAIPNAPPVQAVNPPTVAEPAPSRMASAQPVRAERRAPAVRSRPAAAATGADTVGVNTSATLPAGPQPYTTLNPDMASAPTAEPQTLTIPPVQAAPIPETPPTAPTEIPQAASPDTTTPPN